MSQSLFEQARGCVTTSLKHDKNAGLLEVCVTGRTDKTEKCARLRYDVVCNTRLRRCTCRVAIDRTIAMVRLLCLMGLRPWTVRGILDGTEHMTCEDVRRGATYACELGVQNMRLPWAPGTERRALVTARPLGAPFRGARLRTIVTHLNRSGTFPPPAPDPPSRQPSPMPPVAPLDPLEMPPRKVVVAAPPIVPPVRPHRSKSFLARLMSPRAAQPESTRMRIGRKERRRRSDGAKKPLSPRLRSNK